MLKILSTIFDIQNRVNSEILFEPVEYKAYVPWTEEIEYDLTEEMLNEVGLKTCQSCKDIVEEDTIEEDMCLRCQYMYVSKEPDKDFIIENFYE